jgi:hypothetical protein
MIKANELRIGNLVLGRFGGDVFPREVIGIDNSTVYFTEGFENRFRDKQDLEDVKPIPLTEEWLVRFGFEKEEADAKGIAVWDEFYHGTFLISNHGTGIEDYHFIAYEGEVVDVRFVHELQNLFFAIKREELTIKEKVA